MKKEGPPFASPVSQIWNSQTSESDATIIVK